MHDLIELRRELTDYEVRPVIHSPKQWTQYANTTHLSWKEVRFEWSQRLAVPDDVGGVYTFSICPGIVSHLLCSQLVYVGKAERQTLRARFKQYFGEKNKPKGRPRIQRFMTLSDGYLWFCFARIPDQSLIHDIEADLLNAYLPPFNTQFPGTLGRPMRVL